MSLLFGSICLSDIPKEQMKKVLCKDGKERIYLNVSVVERKQPQEFNGKLYTHFISCAPKQEERKEGVNYYIGDLITYQPTIEAPSAEQIANAPSVGDDDDDCPF